LSNFSDTVLLRDNRVDGIMLAFRCPVTKKYVEATIKTPESKLRSLGSFQLPLWCRACHCAHAVSAQEIFVAEEA
jgi:hypothetical protein